MVTISKFFPCDVKPCRVFLVTPDVPTFWGGYYAIYKASGAWIKRWHASDTGKTIKGAFAKIKVESAHKINWQHYMKF